MRDKSAPREVVVIVLANKDIGHDILTPKGAWVSIIMAAAYLRLMPCVLPRREEVAVAVEAIVAYIGVYGYISIVDIGCIHYL
jgi:hypothetical protein